MDKKYQIIKKEVKTQLQLRGIIDKKYIEEFTQTCFDDYKIALGSGMNEEESLNQAYYSLKEALDSYKMLSKQYIPFHYSYIISVISFVTFLIISVIGWLVQDVLSVYSIIYPILFLLVLVMLVYTVFTFRKRDKFDLITVIVLFLSVLSIFIQCLMYFYRARTGNFYYSLYYDFPGFLKFNRHILVSMNPITYELTSTIVLFDPTLLVSLISLITSLLVNVKKRRKNIC